MTSGMQIARQRTENYTQQERRFLVDLVESVLQQVETKRCDTKSNRDKSAAWQYVARRYNAHQTESRSATQLKTLWFETKRRAKAAFRALREFQEHQEAGILRERPPNPSLLLCRVHTMISGVNNVTLSPQLQHSSIPASATFDATQKQVLSTCDVTAVSSSASLDAVTDSALASKDALSMPASVKIEDSIGLPPAPTLASDDGESRGISQDNGSFNVQIEAFRNIEEDFRWVFLVLLSLTDSFYFFSICTSAYKLAHMHPLCKWN